MTRASHCMTIHEGNRYAGEDSVFCLSLFSRDRHVTVPDFSTLVHCGFGGLLRGITMFCVLFSPELLAGVTIPELLPLCLLLVAITIFDKFYLKKSSQVFFKLAETTFTLLSAVDFMIAETPVHVMVIGIILTDMVM